MELREVTVVYGSTVAVDRVSLRVEPGETVAVVGPSGSGKSTVLRAVAGLEPLVGGEIFVDGRSLVGVATHQRDVGLMFQDHALFTHLDVGANVGFGLRMKGWSSAQIRARVEELLKLVGLSGFERRGVHQLSGGEAQRVALARALAPTPGLLMLDEPFGSLDRLLREELTAEVRRLLVELGQTALHVTHDQVEAFAVADRVAVLADGRLHQIGDPDELWRSPRSVFVAEFLGHPNIWTVIVTGDGMLVDGQCLAERGAWLDRGAWPEGPSSVVVPLDAVRVDAGGPLQVLVTSVVFREGRYRITGRLAARGGLDRDVGGVDRAGNGAGGGGGGAGNVVTVEARSAPAVGDTVSVSVDANASTLR